MSKNRLRLIHQLFGFLFFDPLEMIRKWRGIPYYLDNLKAYNGLNCREKFQFRWSNALPVLQDRFTQAGGTRGHYFWQDLWAARHIYESKIQSHVDVGSRLDGFIAHILPFCRVTYVDIRPLDTETEGLEYRRGSILEMPFQNDSVASLSSLHVIEHIGLGRYGDKVQPDGYIQGAKELARILAPNHRLYIGTPVGIERLFFDAHRVFDPQTIINIFAPLQLIQFSLIDDQGDRIYYDASFDKARSCRYGCGLFVFQK